ncbi:helix-turn-helix domain-containing protein [Saccharopolyspora sp. K220]|uniref:helix-turn-helix domain-containing protein n=1 Tax=Saccharopolyspora soli TaxID=2926618 RepID=UPI001F56A208|nr:helix-turn-helix domain-containing protein [Saccharopolyspora soli]MCI2415846.1 helix-turn-helix domain-containing protein [Saccharopolyspora soli]
MDQHPSVIKVGARSLPVEALERLRRQVVAAVESGVSQSHVARTFGVSRKTVGTWVRAYQEKGEQAFRPRRRGRRRGEQLALSTAQQEWLVTTAVRGSPDELGLPHLLWTRRAVADLIRARFAITLSPATIDQYLSRWELLGRSDQLAPGHDGSRRGLGGREVLWTAWTCPRPLVGPDRLHALVAVTNRGVLFFRLGESPFDGERLADFRKRLRVQLASDITVVVRMWPAEQSQLLGHWRAVEPDVVLDLATH